MCADSLRWQEHLITKLINMDPFTQAVAGATASQICSSKNKIIIATIIGALAGLSPDLISLLDRILTHYYF